MITEADREWFKENCGKGEGVGCGLYVMVLLILMNSCDGPVVVRKECDKEHDVESLSHNVGGLLLHNDVL